MQENFDVSTLRPALRDYGGRALCHRSPKSSRFSKILTNSSTKISWRQTWFEDEEDLTGAGKFKKPRLGGAGKFHRLAAPDEADGAGVQRLGRQNEPGKLLRRQTVFDQR